MVNGFRFHRLRSAVKRTSSFPQPAARPQEEAWGCGVQDGLAETRGLLLVPTATPSLRSQQTGQVDTDKARSGQRRESMELLTDSPSDPGALGGQDFRFSKMGNDRKGMCFLPDSELSSYLPHQVPPKEAGPMEKDAQGNWG